jgi:iron-sulfur cluster assembly accessory protein
MSLGFRRRAVYFIRFREAGLKSMAVAEAFDPTSLTLTEGAVSKVRELLSEEENVELKLRVFITGGGCSGFQYGFSFDETAADDDTVIVRDGVTVLVDPLSFPYLAGSEVDYTEGLEGSRFIVNNPNATTTCGCGASFAV